MADALFISLSCYGSWLRGDIRGELSRYSKRFKSPSLRLQSHDRHQLTQAPFTIGPEARWVIHEAWMALAQERDWTIVALNIRTNHTHKLLTTEDEPREVRRLLKRAATHHLRFEKLIPKGRKVWVRGGSIRHVYSPEGLARVQRYILQRQGSPLPSYPPKNRKRPRR